MRSSKIPHCNLLSFQLNDFKNKSYKFKQNSAVQNFPLLKISPKEFKTMSLEMLRKKNDRAKRLYKYFFCFLLVLLWTLDSGVLEKEANYWKLKFSNETKWKNKISHLSSSVLEGPPRWDVIFISGNYDLGLSARTVNEGANDCLPLQGETKRMQAWAELTASFHSEH